MNATENDMSDVTLSRKRYTGPRVFECAVCGALADSRRAHAITCSPRCRTWLCRHPHYLDALHAVCNRTNVTVGEVLEANAVTKLRPDLREKCMRGEITLEDTREPVLKAYWTAIRREIEQQRSAAAA